MDGVIDIDIKKKLVKGGTWALVGKIVTAILGLVSNIILARVLSPADFGTYFLIQTIITVSVTLIILGFDRGIVKFISSEQAKDKDYNISTIIKKIFLAIFLSFIVWAVLFRVFLSSFLDGVLNTTYITTLQFLIIGWVFVAIYQRITTETFRGMHRIDLTVILGGSIRGGIVYGTVFLAILILAALLHIKVSLDLVLKIVIASILTSLLPALYLVYNQSFNQ